MGVFVDWHNNEIFLEDVDRLGPPFDSRVTFLSRTQVHVVLHWVKLVLLQNGKKQNNGSLKMAKNSLK